MGRRMRILEYDDTPALVDSKYFLWDGLSIAEERNGGTPATVTAQYFAQGEIRGSTKYYYGRDHLGSVRDVVDESTGNVVARFDYDPYGRREQTVGAGTFDVDWGFTGHYFHEASGLHLAPFRAYAAELGRWLSRDPAGAVDGPNLYRYALSNPVNYYDPLGLVTAGGIADCWDAFIDWGAAQTAWQGSGPVAFLRNWSHFAAAELAKLPADVARLGRGAAYAWEGYDPCGELGPLDRTLHGLQDVGRLMQFAPASIPFLPKVKPPRNFPKADAPPVPQFTPSYKAPAPIPTINGRVPINSKYAGGVHPSGVRFTEQGFPDFSPFSKAEVVLDDLTGISRIDNRLANQAAGFGYSTTDIHPVS
jgi:RHS repeat-associated protein